MADNVVEFRRPQEMEGDQKAEFFSSLQEDCDAMVFLKRTDEGNYTLGHTPIDSHELVWMLHYLQLYIQRIIINDD
jgi:hypothetical protein